MFWFHFSFLFRLFFFFGILYDILVRFKIATENYFILYFSLPLLDDHRKIVVSFLSSATRMSVIAHRKTQGKCSLLSYNDVKIDDRAKQKSSFFFLFFFVHSLGKINTKFIVVMRSFTFVSLIMKYCLQSCVCMFATTHDFLTVCVVGECTLIGFVIRQRIVLKWMRNIWTSYERLEANRTFLNRHERTFKTRAQAWPRDNW